MQELESDFPIGPAPRNASAPTKPAVYGFSQAKVVATKRKNFGTLNDLVEGGGDPHLLTWLIAGQPRLPHYLKIFDQTETVQDFFPVCFNICGNPSSAQTLEGILQKR